MELQFRKKEIPVWEAGERIVRKLPGSIDCVIPDTQEDVSRILWPQGSLLLKGKDLGPHAVRVTGELQLCILYLAEGDLHLGSLQTVQPVQLEFPTEEADPQALPHLEWDLSALEVKVLNPRKLSINYEIRAELELYRRESLCLEQELPEGERKGLHLLEQETPILALKTITEKSFSLQEQFSCREGQALPVSSCCKELNWKVISTEQLGSRAVIKGEMHLRLSGIGTSGLPAAADFSAPFSQLVDLGDEPAAFIQAKILPCSVYCDWTDAPGGGKILNADAQGVLQLCAWTPQTQRTVLDAYSNCCPCSFELREETRLQTLEQGCTTLELEEKLPLPDDWEELLSARICDRSIGMSGQKLQANGTLSVLFRKKDATLGAWNRVLRAETTKPAQDILPGICSAEEPELREMNGELIVRTRFIVPWELRRNAVIPAIRQLSLQENECFSSEPHATVSLVRRAGESIWELAKAYRSSPEAIQTWNPDENDLLLIPAELF